MVLAGEASLYLEIFRFRQFFSVLRASSSNRDVRMVLILYANSSFSSYPSPTTSLSQFVSPQTHVVASPLSASMETRKAEVRSKNFHRPQGVSVSDEHFQSFPDQSGYLGKIQPYPGHTADHHRYTINVQIV